MQAIECNAATKIFFEKMNKNNGNSSKWYSKLNFKKSKKIITAVDRVSFSVPKGEIFGILGPNGSGKSTLIRMLSTLILPDSGDMQIFGLDVVKNSMQVRKQINRVSVDAAFFKKLSTWENLSYAARLYGHTPKTIRPKVEQILESLLFPKDKIDNSLENLSRGMQQKVAIARALFTSPALLLLDEPTTGLDPVSKRQVQKFVLEVRKKHDTTVLLTSHDLDEVEKICDRVAIIDKGKFIICDTIEGLKRSIPNNDKKTTLEDVFFKLTNTNLEEDVN